MRAAAVFLVVAWLLVGCGGARPATDPGGRAFPLEPRSCTAGYTRLGSAKLSFAAVARGRTRVLRRPGGRLLARFGRVNANGFPMLFAALGRLRSRDCSVRWYRVQVPVRPNGATGWVRVDDVTLAKVRTRLLVDLSDRRVTLYRAGRVVVHAAAAIGSPATPTPTGRFYVNQRLVPTDSGGPFGPGAIGISAFSNVLTGWTQGGPIAIHGTNAPWSIGRAVSNGCIRIANPTLRRVFAQALAGTPVVIRP